MKRSLVFDGQIFQTPAWHRGMGKYSLELIAALHDLNEQDVIWQELEIVLSRELDIEKAVLQALADRAPALRVTYLDLAKNEQDNIPVAEKNRKVIDAHLSKKLSSQHVSNIDYVVLSLTQSEVAPAFSSLPTVHNILLFYDLIPLMFFNTYFKDKVNRRVYLSKLAELLRADTYVSISKTTANDLAAVMGIDKKRIASIDGAPIEHGHKPSPLKIPKPFILMPTGHELRKNNQRGIEAFNAFNQKHANKYSLVITSIFKDFEVEAYKKQSDNLVFTGNVSGEELTYLYQQADALIFPSKYEGLGLPVLEAVKARKPVACSELSVFREISKEAFFYFDPYDVSTMTSALERAAFSDTVPAEEYRRISQKFTWRSTARLFVEAAQNTPNKKVDAYRPKVNVLCADPAQSKDGVFVQRLHSELQRFVVPRYYLSESARVSSDGLNYLPYVAYACSLARGHCDINNDSEVTVYFMNNSERLAPLLLPALAHPGVLVLESTKLDRVWRGAVAMNYIHKSRFDLEKKIGEAYEGEEVRYIASLLARQQVIVVFTKQAEKIVRKISAKVSSTKPRIIITKRPNAALAFEDVKPDTKGMDYAPTAGTSGNSFADFAKMLSREVLDRKEV